MKFLNEKLNSAKYEAIQRAKTTFKYLKEVRNNKLIQAIKEGKSNEQLKQIGIDAIVDEIKFTIMSKGYEKKLENFDVDLFIFKNFKRSLFSVSSGDLKVIRAAVKGFNNVSRVRLDEFNFINVEYVESPVVPVVEEPVTETVSVEPVTPVTEEPVTEEPVAEEPVSEKQEEAIPSAIKALPVPISNRVTNDDIEEVEYEEVSNTERKPSDYIRQQSILIPNTFRWGRLF
jgi:hypothetical protein